MDASTQQLLPGHPKPRKFSSLKAREFLIRRINDNFIEGQSVGPTMSAARALGPFNADSVPVLLGIRIGTPQSARSIDHVHSHR